MKYGLKYRLIKTFDDGRVERGSWQVEKFYGTFEQILDVFINLKSHYLSNCQYNLGNATGKFQLKVFCTEEEPEISERLKKQLK